jgi:hypothetical protein
MMQVMGQNPQAQKIIAAAQAHIAEHLGFQYRVQMERVSGQKFPPPGEPIPPQQEAELSRGMAQAAKLLLAQNTQQAAQRQAEQAAKDPVVQAQQMDLKIKAAEVDRKAAKDEKDYEIESRRLDIMAEQINSQQENSAFQTMTGAMTQRANAQDQAASQTERTTADVHKTKLQGEHNIANSMLGHMIAGQKNAANKGLKSE